MNILIALIIIIILVLVGYGLLYYLGRKQTRTIIALDERKQNIMAIPVADKLYTIENKNVTGSTRRLYEKERAKWQTINQYKFPEIEEALVSAQSDTDRFSLFKARQIIEQAEALIATTEDEVNTINDSLASILSSEGKNEKYNEETNARYAVIRKQLLAHGYVYGDSQETLEKNLQYIELDFTKYNALMNDGDFIGAHEELDKINEDIHSLEAMMEEIPQLWETVSEVYEEQLEDIQDGYTRLLSENFYFPKEVNLPDEIQKVEKNIEKTRQAIKDADLNEAHHLMTLTEGQIDHTYHLMEKELKAKDYIEQNQGMMQQRLSQVEQSNRYGMLEVDRVSQSYLLHDNEMGKLQDYTAEIERAHQEIDHINQQLGAHIIAYSDMAEQYQNTYAILTTIEKGQSHVVATLASLKQKERDARDDLYHFDLELRNMKRKIEQYHLPGLTESYLDRFFNTEDLIRELGKKLNRVKLDIEEIDASITQINNEIEYLDNETEAIIDEAMLTEATIQYANRYRNDHPDLNKVIQEADDLYHREFKYEEAHQLVSQALDRIEPNASHKVKELYNQDKQSRLF